MPLPLTPEEAMRLNQHLDEIDPALNRFCQAHGFRRLAVRGSVYPHRHIEKVVGPLRYSIELDMDTRFTEFTPDVPYNTGGAASIDIDGCRYWIGYFHNEAIPFGLLRERIDSELRAIHKYLAMWNDVRLRNEGKMVVLPERAS